MLLYVDKHCNQNTANFSWSSYRVHLTPAGRASPCKQGMCLQIACSETEVKLVKSMNSNHRNCYKILKGIFETREEISGHMIISYVLKMLILKHACECMEHELTGACIMKIIRHIEDNYLPYKLKPSARPQVPALGPVFFKEQNIFYFKELKRPVEVLGGTSKQLIKSVNRERNEYPMADDQHGMNQRFRIQVQNDFPSDKRLVICAFSLPLSYMLPMFLVYLPVLCAGIQLPEIMRSVSLYLCFGSIALLPGLPKMLCMLEIISRIGRIAVLVYAVWLYMPWSKRMFVLFSVVIYILSGRTDILQHREPFIYADIYSLWVLFLPRVLRMNANVLTWDNYVILKQKEKLLWQDKCFPVYFIASMSLMNLLQLKCRHACLRTKLLSQLTCLATCSMWLRT